MQIPLAAAGRPGRRRAPGAAASGRRFRGGRGPTAAPGACPGRSAPGQLARSTPDLRG